MNSTYLNNAIDELYAKRDSSLKEEKKLCLEKTKTYKNQISDVSNKGFIISCTTSIGALVGVISLNFYGLISFFICILIGAVVGYVPLIFFEKSDKELVKKIKEIERRSEKNAESISNYYNKEAEKLKTSYVEKVNNAIEVCSKSEVLDPIVKWLTDSLQAEIFSAKREKHINYLEASIAYRVEAREIELLKKMPHSKDYRSITVFNFYKERFRFSGDFFGRIGLAKVLSKYIELELEKRILNGSIEEKYTADHSFSVESNDTFIEIKYKALNPDYIPIVDIIDFNSDLNEDNTDILENSEAEEETFLEPGFDDCGNSDDWIACPYCSEPVSINFDVEVGGIIKTACPHCGATLEFELI